MTTHCQPPEGFTQGTGHQASGIGADQATVRMNLSAEQQAEIEEALRQTPHGKIIELVPSGFDVNRRDLYRAAALLALTYSGVISKEDLDASTSAGRHNHIPEQMRVLGRIERMTSLLLNGPSFEPASAQRSPEVKA